MMCTPTELLVALRAAKAHLDDGYDWVNKTEYICHAVCLAPVDGNSATWEAVVEVRQMAEQEIEKLGFNPKKWTLDEAWNELEGHVPYVECQRRRHALLDQWIAEAEAQIEPHRQTEV